MIRLSDFRPRSVIRSCSAVAVNLGGFTSGRQGFACARRRIPSGSPGIGAGGRAFASTLREWGQMIRSNVTSPVPASGTARHPFIDALASDEAIGQRMVAALAHSDPRVSHLRSALLSALLGDAHGAEVALIRAH